MVKKFSCYTTLFLNLSKLFIYNNVLLCIAWVIKLVYHNTRALHGSTLVLVLLKSSNQVFSICQKSDDVAFMCLELATHNLADPDYIRVKVNFDVAIIEHSSTLTIVMRDDCGIPKLGKRPSWTQL